MRTSTSPAFGPATSTCSMVSGWPAPQPTAARDFMVRLLRGDGGHQVAARCDPSPMVSIDRQVIRPERRHVPAVIRRIGLQPVAETLQAALLLRRRRIDLPVETG